MKTKSEIKAEVDLIIHNFRNMVTDEKSLKDEFYWDCLNNKLNNFARWVLDG